MLAQRPFRLLWLAHTMPAAGSAITQAILPILLYQLTGSVVQTAVLLLMTTMPYLLLGLPAGAVADRTNRRRVMLVGCAAGALVWAAPPRAGRTRAAPRRPPCPPD